MLKSSRAASALLFALIATSTAESTILIRQDLGDLVRGADAVVRARAVANVAGYGPDRQYIWTWTTLDVIETWKGDVPARFALRELGGEVGDIGMRVAGAPKYSAGEEVVVFLKRDVQGALRTLGWTQGKFAISSDPERAGAKTATVPHAHVLESSMAPSALRGPGRTDLGALREKVATMVAALPASKETPK